MLINEIQHGFVNGKYYLTNLLDTTVQWTVSQRLYNKDIVLMAYIDYSKAFDSVPISRLLINAHSSLKANGYKVIYCWINGFLCSHIQNVAVKRLQVGTLWRCRWRISGVCFGTITVHWLFDMAHHMIGSVIQWSNRQNKVVPWSERCLQDLLTSKTGKDSFNPDCSEGIGNKYRWKNQAGWTDIICSDEHWHLWRKPDKLPK